MLQLSDVFGSEREGIPKMLENTDRTIGSRCKLPADSEKRFDLFRLLLASRGSSAAREADEIMMQIKRKLEMIWQRVSDRILFLSMPLLLQMNSMLSKGSVYAA